MKRILVVLYCLFAICSAQAQKVRVKTGIEILKEQNFKCLEGKRVGLVTNPSGVDNGLRSDIDILHEAPNVKLVALFGPEHAKWIGLTPTDLVFPFFMFMMGITTYLSLSKYHFEFTGKAGLKILKRTALIWLIGLAISCSHTRDGCYTPPPVHPYGEDGTD